MPTKSVSRRTFFKVAGISLGASCLVCSGLGYAATRKPPAPEIETPGFTYGVEKPGQRRVLVTYATRTGSTVGVASAIGETLGSRGFLVDVKPVKDNPSTEGYDAVCIGSAINGGQWLPEAVEFARVNQAALARTPAALFCVHIMNLGDDETSREKRRAYLDTIRPLVKPAHEGFLAGIGIEVEKASWLERLAYQALDVGPEGDCRDWDAIQDWTQSIFG